MRLAVVTQPGHRVLPPAGSLEIWADEVSRRLAGEHEITIYASGAADDSVVADGLEYRLLSHERGALLRRVARLVYRALPEDRPYFASGLHPIVYWLKIGRDIRRTRPDVVHVSNYAQAIPILRRFSPSSRFVLHMHCEWLNQLSRRMIARRLRSVDVVVGCSRHITTKVVDRYPEHADRCRTIYNGVDVARFASDEPRRQTTRTRLLNVGRVSPEKGLHVLVDAFNELVEERPDLELVIVGDDAVVPIEMAVAISDDPPTRELARFYDSDYTQSLRDRLSRAAAERVTFVGRVEHDETDRFYREADIFVFPSLFESFAIPPVEAMAAGLPVVASRAGGMVETIVHGETGFLVEREDPQALAAALKRLIDDRDLRRTLGDAGRRRAELFAWPRIVADVEHLLAELAPDTRAAPAPAAHPVELR